MSDPQPTVLLVDDDERMRSVLAARLSGAGFRCILAGSGSQAMARFREHDVRAVVTDLNMPIGDGVALATSIRQISAVPIVFITGFRDAYRRTMRQVSDVTILEKPFDAKQLIDLIECHVARRGDGDAHSRRAA